jgi:TolB-like protein
VGAILGGLAGYWSTYRTVTTELLAPPAPKPMPSQLSIVVLPFTNLGGDSQHDYLADGITDSLTTDLSRALPGSFVVPRDTAFTYRNRGQTYGKSAVNWACVTRLPAACFPMGTGCA